MVISYKHYKLAKSMSLTMEKVFDQFRETLHTNCLRAAQSAGDSAKLNLCIKDMEYLLMFYLKSNMSSIRLFLKFYVDYELEVGAAIHGDE